eukprot:2241997-Prymnesium_polylepis.1
MGARPPVWLAWRAGFRGAELVCASQMSWQDLNTILAAAGVELPVTDIRKAAVTLATECVNCKSSSVIETYTQALLQRPQAACKVCRYYANDFTCLGYVLPDACAAC